MSHRRLLRQLEKRFTMAKNWNKLTVADFQLDNPDWESDYPTARVDFLGLEVALDVPDLEEVTDNEVAIFKSAIEAWGTRADAIAKETETFLQRFLPGRKIDAKEILLECVSIEGDDEPTECTFSFTVDGDYSDPSYQLDEFDSSSVVEYQYSIEGGKINWDNPFRSTTNDFA